MPFPMPTRTGDRRGVALLTTMLLVMLLLVAVTAAFTRSSSEFRTATDQTAVVDAFALAQSGLDSYLAGQPSMPTTLPDSQVFPLPGGRAVVTLRAARISGSDSTFVLISRGENTTTNRYNRTATRATRTVAQLLRRSSGSLSIPAGFTALSGFDKNGNSGSLSGVDHCTTGAAPLPSIPGVAVPQISTLNPLPMYTGHTGPINGNPDNVPVTIGTPGPSGTARNAIPVDWQGVVSQTAIVPHYYRSSTGTWTPSSPPTSGSAYPIVFIDGDYTGKFPGNEQGILIVTGNITLNGNTDWNGILLVGGTLTSNGNNTVYGAILTGLNIMLGQAVPVQAVGNGTKIYQYDSCEITNALAPFSGWQRLGNAWVDSWPSY